MVLVENVLGLYRHAGGRDFREVVLGLHRLRYRLAVFVLDAAWFVPQSRVRVFIVGITPGLAIPSIDIPYWWELQVRPPRLALLMNAIGLPWLRLAPPPPPPREDRLADVVDLHGPWWPQERVRQYRDRMTPRSRTLVEGLLAGGGLHVGTAGWKRSGWFARFDGVAHCLLSPRNGSGPLVLAVVDGGRMRMRRLSVVECGLLMGSAEDWTRFPSGDARRGLADGVAVPVVRWIDQHILTPIRIANGL
jgi:DNA (cytosine-5)-methyltransferase 1